jgi:hypothetical protein
VFFRGLQGQASSPTADRPPDAYNDPVKEDFMTTSVLRDLSEALEKIDRPGSFCVSGSVPVVLPGLEVAGLGPIGLPLTAVQAEELKKLCEQAPYGKGEETVVDTNVRRVWRLTPDRFTLSNPDWGKFLRQTVRRVQEELGLKRQKLESHLYDLLHYEPGSFFLPHRDGEKLDRMVATLVVVLPSSFEGGELIVRHEGEERTIDFGGARSQFHTHFAAFYADCEHEIRPLCAGYRLCLVYNLTLAKSKKKGITAPRQGEHIERVSQVVRDWVNAEAPRKLVVTLDHQYTQEGLAWDALKGVDRARAYALREAARRADCQAFLGLLTLHESGSAAYSGGDGWGRRRRWYQEEEESGPYEMEEVFETALTAEHWIDADGNRPPLGTLDVDEDEVLDPEGLQDVTPEEEFEGYTGNAGMTLDRWYRHAAVFLWPNTRHFEVLCDAGIASAVAILGPMVQQWQQSGKKAAALRAECAAFAAVIIARWTNQPHIGSGIGAGPPGQLFPLLETLDEPALIEAYLREVLPRDAAADPGASLVAVCRQHGWETFQPALQTALQQTTAETVGRNVRLLEHLCLASARGEPGWAELCQVLAQTLVAALEGIDQAPATPDWDWRSKRVVRADVLVGLARALLATGQEERLAHLVDHALARPEKYPLATAHVMALKLLEPWLAKHVKQASPALAHWLAACCEQLEALTAEEPQPPADYRRTAAVSCTCGDCSELKRFLNDPQEPEHRFRVVQARRSHLEERIRAAGSDLDLRTERKGSPHTLVCTKNRASYQAKLDKFRQDQKDLAALRSIQAGMLR